MVENNQTQEDNDDCDCHICTLRKDLEKLVGRGREGSEGFDEAEALGLTAFKDRFEALIRDLRSAQIITERGASATLTVWAIIILQNLLGLLGDPHKFEFKLAVILNSIHPAIKMKFAENG